MQLLSVWIDSLKLLKPKNFKLFIGATFLAIVRTYKVWLSTWWWLIVLLYGSLLYSGSSAYEYTTIGLLQYCVYMFLASLAYMSARPSVDPKTYRYFLEHTRHIIAITLLFIVSDLCFSSFMIQDLGPLSAIIWLLLWIFIMPNAEFAAFFVADSSGSLPDVGRSLVRALRMTLYALPLLLVIMFGCIICLLAVVFGASLLYRGFINNITVLNVFVNCWSFISVVLLPVPIAFFATLYVKRLYDNSALYLE